MEAGPKATTLLFPPEVTCTSNACTGFDLKTFENIMETTIVLYK
jgi:hypothetical protein